MAKASNFGITQERLKEVVHYDPETGLFTWLRDAGSRARTGKPAGIPKKGCHVRICIDRVPYKAHRLAFLYMVGRWPDPEADHIDLEKSNNKWSNIREATRSQNMSNTPLRKTSQHGLKGVTWAKDREAWRAQITHNYKTIVIGSFQTKEEAHEAYCEFARRLRGDFARAA